MAQCKHTFTPGPWRSHNNPASNYGLEVVADNVVKAKRVICRTGGPDREANALLIAAAPELLAALKEALAALNGAPNTVGLHDQINAAIAKAATGGAS